MSRSTIYKNTRIHVIGGKDQALGNFIQMYDNTVNDDPSGEGIVFEWSQAFGIENNRTGFSNELNPDEIVRQYIEKTKPKVDAILEERMETLNK